MTLEEKTRKMLGLYSLREVEIDLSTKDRETLPALFQSRAIVSGLNSGFDAVKKIYHLQLFTLNVANIVTCRGQFSNKWNREIKVSI